MDTLSLTNGYLPGDALPQMIFEKKNVLEDGSGFRLQLEEISFNQIDLKWGSYLSPQEKVISFLPDKTSIVSHFLMYEPLGKKPEKGKSIREKEFVVYRQAPAYYELNVASTGNDMRSFFELIVSDCFFNNLMTTESAFLTRFNNYDTIDTPSLAFTASMSAAMDNVIHDMQHNPYSGYLKGIYLEAKATELFLMQVHQLDQQNNCNTTKLTTADIARLHDLRTYLSQHFEEPCSIMGLARKAGINQMKLKNGFKMLFNTTVFGYLGDLRMGAAKRMLLDEKMTVQEVSDRIGYKYAHHFTVAFKKKFGMLPKDLKN